MALEQKLIVTGLGALVVGFVLGTFTAPGLDDIGETVEASFAPTSDTLRSGVSGLGDQITSGVGGLGDQVSALNERLSAMEAKIDSAATAAADTTGLDALEARIEALSVEIGDSLSRTQGDIATRLSGLGDQISSAASAPAAVAAAEMTDAQATETPEPLAADNATVPQGLTAGQAAVFGDGAVRAFVSMVGEEGARVSVNGAMSNLSVGDSITSGDCLLTLETVDRGHAEISGACGAAVPAAAGFGPGDVALFDDGATRVFVSGVSDDGSAARLAVNGLALTSVAKGDSVPVGEDSPCSVVVEGIDRGHVQLGYACGG